MNGKAMRKHATSIALVTAALGLGGYLWLIDRDRPSTEALEARKDNLLPVLRRDEIRSIVIEQNGRQATIERRDEGDAGDFMFYFVPKGQKSEDAPYADQVAVERLMQALEFATRLRELEDLDLDQAGLASPSTRLTVRMGSITYRIGVGDEAKMPAGSRYVQLEGQGVFVIPRAQAQQLLEPIESYRTRRVIPYATSKVASIEIDAEQGETKLVRASWDGFRVDNLPGRPRVSRAVFNRVLGALADANAERFLPADVATKAQEEAEQKVELVFVPKDEGEPPAEIVFGGACPEENGKGNSPKLVVLVRKAPQPLHACVPASVLGDLQIPPSAFAERSAFVGNPDEVESIEIVRGEETLELARKGGGWHVRKPEDRQIPAQDVDGFLSGLLSIEGSIVGEPKVSELGLDPPRGTVTLHHPSLKEKEVPPQIIEIGGETKSDTGPAMALRRKVDGVVLLVPAATDRLLRPSTTLIRSTELLSISAMGIQKIAVSWSGHRQVLERDGAGFELEVPAGYDVDAPLAADLFDALAHLKAERWVADQDDGAFGLAEPSMRAAFEYSEKQGETKRRVLLFGAPTVEGRYAKWEDGGGVFVLPRSLTRVLTTWVVDRSAFMIDPNEVQSLTLQAGDREVRVAAMGESWRTPKESDVQLPEHTLAKIRRILIDMRAEGTVHLGPPRPEQGMGDAVLRIRMQPRAETRKGVVDITFGRADVWNNMNIHYARRKGIDATFAMAQSKVRSLLELVGDGSGGL